MSAARMGERPHYYILDNRKACAVDNVLTWGRWFEKADRRVAQTTSGAVRVSTVFLGIDHGWGIEPPLLFETMVFGGEHDGEQERCSTWEEAEAQHETVCRRAGLAS